MSEQNSKERYTTVCIGGMTCASCELLLERKLKAVPGIKDVDVDYKNGVARITAHADKLPSAERISTVIEKAGYHLMNEDSSTPSALSPDNQKWVEIGGSLVVMFALYKLLQVFDFVSLAPSTSGVLSMGGVFIIGLVAGTSSCLAVTGGLLVGLAAKHNEIHQAETPWQKFRPLLHFNLGRLCSYFILGGFVGILGKSITLSANASGYMSVIVALIMLYIGLSILEIIPKGRLFIRPPKKLSRWIASFSESDHPAAPFTLGACTFFLPCGFTQSLQLAALASGSFISGAMMMFIFALGTLPSLLGISAISSTARGTFSRLFLRFSGALVLVLGLFNLNSGLALTGVDLSRVFIDVNQAGTTSVPPIIGGVQEVSMAITRYGYEPKNMTIKAGVPVRWKINGNDAYGCTSVMTIPSLNITKPILQGENIIEFTPSQKGELAFMCSMGMVRGSFTVL